MVLGSRQWEVSGLLQATASGYEIKRVKGRMGDGEFEGEGRIDATNWSPTRFGFTATLSPREYNW